MKPRLSYPAQLALAYAGFAAVWIVFSDHVVALSLHDTRQQELASAAKGLLFVAVTAVLLYGLARGFMRRLELSVRTADSATADGVRSQRLLRELIDNSPDAIFAKDLEGRYLLANAEVSRTTGKPVAQVLGLKDEQLYPAELAERMRRTDLDAIQGDAVVSSEVRIPAPEGELVYIVVTGPLHDAQGRVSGTFGIARDITERKRHEDELQIAASVYNTSREGILITDAQTRIIAINRAFTALTGYSASDVLGQTPQVLKSGRQSPQFYREMWARLNAEGQWVGEIWNRRKDGTIYLEHLNINVERAADGSVRRYVAMFLDITEQKARDQAIWRNANFDALTGLPNRRLFYDRLEQEMKKVRHGGRSLALLLLDLDQFKEVNDTLGHAKGDVLLVEVARRIGHCVRDSDTIARLGGDEFMVILPEYGSLATIDRIAQSVLLELARPYSLGEDLAHVTASIGITLYTEGTETLSELLQHADQAMYAAKQAGRNQASYFTAAMQVEALDRLQLTNDLRKALKAGEFELHYQPIVTADGTVVKAEALLRWHHPTRGLLAPGSFIGLAEESGLIVDIGDWAFRQAIADVQRWKDRTGVLIQVSVNKSPIQFLRSDHHVWLDLLARAGLGRGSITIEITERLLITDSAKVRDALNDFQAAGIEVAIDDFGTGFSALSYLHQFDVDYLKIDASFVHQLVDSESSRTLTEAIITMAHKLGIATVAEGVETEQQRRLLLGYGCDFLQGYLFSRPVPAEQFEQLLTREVATPVT